MIDGVDLTEVANDFSDLSDSDEIIVDGISGITNQQMFSLLNPNITSIIDFNNALISSGYLQGSNTQSALNNLFSSY